MGVDPFSVGSAIAPHLINALAKFRNQNEARRFFYELHGLLRRDSAILHDSRTHLADRLRDLMVDPSFQGVLDDYLEKLDVAAVSQVEAFVRPLVTEEVAEEEIERTVQAVMRNVDLAVNRAKANPRDAMVLQTERVIAEIQKQAVPPVVYALLDVEWAPDWPRKALRKLGQASPQELQPLRERVGGGEDLDRIQQLIREPDHWTSRASGHVWIALARFAEHHGEWLLAREALQRALADPPKGDPVNILVHSAISAAIAGDEATYHADLERAKVIDSAHARLRLELVAEVADPMEQLDVLARLSFDEADLNALVETHQAAAYLRLNDVGRAREHVEEAKKHNSDMLQVQMLDANVEIHENRLRVAHSRPIDGRSVAKAGTNCLELRDRLLKQNRPEEAARLLMLAADAATIVGDPQHAARLLREATDDERMRGDGDEALAEAAIRAREPELALQLLAAGKPDTAARRRLRAYASVFIRTADPEGAAEELDKLLNESNSERSAVALARLLASAVRGVDWSDAAEQILAQVDSHAALSLKARWLSHRGRIESVRTLLEPYRLQPWAAEALFWATARAGHMKDAAALASDYLQRHTPGHDLRLEFAGAFADAGLTDRARSELRFLADDLDAPENVRRHAFWGLVTLAKDIADRFELIEEWRRNFPSDEEVDEEIRRLDERIRRGA